MLRDGGFREWRMVTATDGGALWRELGAGATFQKSLFYRHFCTNWEKIQMSRLVSYLAPIVCLCALAGCSETPLVPKASPARTRLDGYTYGSGNAVGTGPQQTTTATAPQVAVEADTSSRSGYTYGSGN